jgi:hypothetical protein
MVVFSPTSLADTLLAQGAELIHLGEDWLNVRGRVLRRLREAREANARETLNDLLARLSDATAPLDFCTEMIGALLLNMHRVKQKADTLNPFGALAALRENDDGGLEALAGLSVGATLSADDKAGPSLTRRLLDHVHRYQSNLSKLNTEARSALVQFLEDALEALD